MIRFTVGVSAAIAMFISANNAQAQLVTFDTSATTLSGSILGTLSATQIASGVNGTPSLSRTTLTTTGGGAAGSFYSTNANITSTLNLSTNYVGFTVTASAGNALFATGINWTSQGNETAPNNYATAYSTDAFTTSVSTTYTGTTATTATARSFDITDLITNDTLAVRLYNYGSTAIGGAASTSAGTFRVISPTVTGGTVSTASGAITLAAATEIRTGSTLNLGGIIDGGFGITKTGAGILTLGGANTYTGGTTISAGAIQIAINSTPTSGTPTAGPLGTGVITLLGGGLDSASGNGAATSSFAIGNAITIGNGSAVSLTLGSNHNPSIGTDVLTFNGNVTLTGSGAIQHTLASNFKVADVFNGTISGSAGLILTAGAAGQGAIQFMADNAATYSGSTTIASTIVVVGNNNALGTGTITLNTPNAAGVNYGSLAAPVAAGAIVIPNPISISTPTILGKFVFGSATGQTLELSGPITLGNGLNEVNAYFASTTKLSGVIDGVGGLNFGYGGGTTAVGNLLLSNSNTYSGGTVINTGTLQLGNAAALGTGILTIGSAGGTAGTLDLGGQTTSPVGTFSGTGGTVTNGSATTNAVLVIAQTSDGTYAGIIKSGGTRTTALKLDATSSRALTLTGVNTYTGGTTLNGGTLIAANATGSATGTGAVIVNSGATLAGTGTVGGAATVNTGATIRGDFGTGTGTLALGGTAKINGGGTFATYLSVDGGGSITANSKLAMGSNTMNLDSVSGAINVRLLHDDGLIAGQAYTIVLATSSAGTFQRRGAAWNATTNAFTSADFKVISDSGLFAPDNTSLAVNGNNLQLTFTATSAAVPEPGFLLSLAAFSFGSARLLRRKKRVE